MARVGILVVEDEWLVAEEHRLVLEEAGYDVVGPAPSVRLAGRLIESQPVAAAVLDIGLNGETSAPLVPYLQERNIPFIFVSGYVSADVPASLINHQILAKPIIATALVAAVGKMLDEHSR